MRAPVRAFIIGAVAYLSTGCCTVKQPVDNSALAAAKMLHLGDGTITANFSFIARYLRTHPGSAGQAQNVARAQREAMRSPMTIKPPSANIVESEFSHLLGAVMRGNDGVGAAVFDRYGLKVGAAGVQTDSIVLAKRRLAAALALRPNDGPLIVRQRGLLVFYRPVFDHHTNPARSMGVSVLVIEQ